MTTPTPDPSIRLQNIALETQELLAQRQMSWTEATNRASMFMTIVGAAVFGLALVGNATNFDSTFNFVCLLVLPILLLVGISSLARMSELDYHDWLLMKGLNRLRRLRVDLDPGLAPFLINSVHDDFASVLDSYGPVNERLHGFWTLGALIGTLVAVLAGFIAGLLAISIGVAVSIAIIVGVLTFIAVALLGGLVGYRSWQRARTSWQSEFPASILPTSESTSTEGMPTRSA